eukprot:403373353
MQKQNSNILGNQNFIGTSYYEQISQYSPQYDQNPLLGSEDTEFQTNQSYDQQSLQSDILQADDDTRLQFLQNLEDSEMNFEDDEFVKQNASDSDENLSKKGYIVENLSVDEIVKRYFSIVKSSKQGKNEQTIEKIQEGLKSLLHIQERDKRGKPIDQNQNDSFIAFPYLNEIGKQEEIYKIIMQILFR